MTPFDFVSEHLERETALSRIEARGVMRFTLREAGLDHTATADEMAVVVRRVLPRQLTARCVDADDALCEQIALAIGRQTFDAAARTDTAVEVFRRLAGD